MLSILSERNLVAESTCFQGKELELLLWVHSVFIVLVAAHLELLSGLRVWVKVKPVGIGAVGGGHVICEIGGGPGG